MPRNCFLVSYRPLAPLASRSTPKLIHSHDPHAEFASPAVAAAALEQCRGKKIGDSSCKFDVCQKLPNFSNKPAKRERRPPRAAAPAPAEASAASESKREA